jgi:hypothetical protein
MDEHTYQGNSKDRELSANMAFTTVSQLVEHIDELSLASPYDAGKGMKIQSIRFRGAPLHLKLSDDSNLSVPFEPSSWGGGSETRRSIVFNIPQPLFEAMAEVEDWCRQVLEDAHPTVQALWTSCIKPAERYSASLKAKINIAGPRQAKFYDEAGQQTDPPASWKGLNVNAVVHVRGVYIQKQGIGLMLEVTDLCYAKPSESACPFL